VISTGQSLDKVASEVFVAEEAAVVGEKLVDIDVSSLSAT